MAVETTYKMTIKDGKIMDAKKTIRPDADIEFDTGEDGRNPRYLVKYSCPECGARTQLNYIACKECGTFFDWTKKAQIKVEQSIYWE